MSAPVGKTGVLISMAVENNRRALMRACIVNRCACARACGWKNRTFEARFQGEKLVLFDVWDN